jgi:hypothetical protein
MGEKADVPGGGKKKGKANKLSNMAACKMETYAPEQQTGVEVVKVEAAQIETDEWTCEGCSYLNPTSDPTCELCECLKLSQLRAPCGSPTRKEEVAEAEPEVIVLDSSSDEVPTSRCQFHLHLSTPSSYVRMTRSIR